MTIKELKEKLNEFPDDAEVLICYSYNYDCDENNYGQIDEEKEISYICPKEPKTRKNQKPIVKTVLINC